MNDKTYCYATMGALIFNFQSLESELIQLLCEMIDSQNGNLPRILTTSLSFKRVVDALGSLSIEKLGADSILNIRLQDVLRKSLAVEGERNRYVHSHYELMEWDIMDKVRFSQEKHKVEFKSGYKVARETFDPRKVDEVCLRIGDALVLLLEVSNEIVMHLYPDRFGPKNAG